MEEQEGLDRDGAGGSASCDGGAVHDGVPRGCACGDARRELRQVVRRRRFLLRGSEREHLELARDAAVRRGRRAAARDRYVLLAVDGEDGGPRRDLVAGLEVPEDRPGLEVERAQRAVPAACEADPGRGRGDARC